jgi:hypothetical protein
MGVSAVLMQNGHPLAFISKALGPRTRGLSTYEKEYLAILIAVDQWRAYLQLAKFIIFMDQKSLIHLIDQRLHKFWQQKVFTKLLDLQYKILYKKGSNNGVADALSRHLDPPSQLMAISYGTPIWLDKVQEGYQKDSKAQQMMTALVVDPGAVPNFALHNGVLRYKNRVYIVDNPELQQEILQALHAQPLVAILDFQ